MGRTHYDLRDVRAICELARAKGFREAAEVLAITPSALSRRVAKLEDALGGLLVKRTTRSMILTPLGRRLVSRCQPLLVALDESIEELARIGRGMEGQVAVGCIPSVSYALLAPVLAGFRAAHPNLRFHMKEADGATIAAAVANHEVDFGLTTVAERYPGLKAQWVARDPFVLVCSTRHPLARRRSQNWEQVVGQRLMGYKASSSIRLMLDSAMARAGIELLWFDEVDTLSSLISYLGTGNFVGIVPKLVAAQLTGLATVALAQPRLHRDLHLVRRADEALTPPAQELWQAISERVKATAATSRSRGSSRPAHAAPARRRRN